MIRITQFRAFEGLSSRQSASRYFYEDFGKRPGMTHEDLLTIGVGQYEGRCAKRLGLSGVQADGENFRALERNRHPASGEQITPRMNGTRKEQRWNGKEKVLETVEVSNRRPGADFCFVVPKSLSMAMAENPGAFRESCMDAIKASWRETMDDLEGLAKTRVRKGGAQEDRATGNLLYVPVIHEDARPVGAQVPDPYYHVHTFIFNVTHDAVEGQFKALEMSGLIKHADDYDAFFLARLEGRLTRMGIGTERTVDPKGRQSFELTGVGEDARRLFSKRHGQVVEQIRLQERVLERRVGAILVASARVGQLLDKDKVYIQEKQRIGKQSRGKKQKGLDAQSKLQALRDQMPPEVRASLGSDALREAPRRNWQEAEDARREVLGMQSEKQSPEERLKAAAEVLRRSGGEALPLVQEWLAGEPAQRKAGSATLDALRPDLPVRKLDLGRNPFETIARRPEMPINPHRGTGRSR